MIRVRMVPASPFVRKCRIAAAHLGLTDRVVFVDHPDDESNELRRNNPLGKIPVAVTEDGDVLYDSRVILEYFDHLAGGGRIIPSEPAARFRTLTMQALADGVLDAAVLLQYENRFREPHEHSPRWKGMQQGKLDSGLDAFEAADLKGPVDVGRISLACALGFLDLRFEGKWRNNRPGLVRFLDGFAAEVPSFEATRAAR